MYRDFRSSTMVFLLQYHKNKTVTVRFVGITIL